jgi:hypothetical protein|tara:strand:- start:7835 stop:8263 length:429 start_codon:yes stop_codon:yes gene_type:complete
MSLAPNSAEFQLSASFYYLCARLGLVAIAAALIAVLPLLIWVKLSALLCLGFAACWLIVDYRGQCSEKLILLDASEDRWRLVSGSQTLELVLTPTQFVTRHLVIAYFKLPQGRQIVRVLPTDSLSAPQHRLLRMLLIERTIR